MNRNLSLIGSLRMWSVTRLLFFSILTVTLCLSVTQCSNDTGTTKTPLNEANASRQLIALVDSSTTFRGQVPQALGDLLNVVEQTNSSRCYLSVARIDSELRELYTGRFPEDNEAFLGELVDGVTPTSGHDNIYLQRGFAWVEERVNASQAPCVILISTDGFGEGMSAKDCEAVSHIAKSFEGDRRVIAVYLTGVDPRNREKLRSWLKELSPKLRLVSTGKLDASEVAGLLTSGGSGS